MTDWQPIETAPCDGTFILTWGDDERGDGDRYVVAAWSTRGKEWYSPLSDEPMEGVTHWQPLPGKPAL